MKATSTLPIVISFVICFSCSQEMKQGIKVLPVDSVLHATQVCVLKENIDIMAPIKSFDILDENHFVVATYQSFTFIYDKTGNQIKKISSIGQGPFEYLNPSIVRVFDNKIFVWCDMLLKLVVFDKEGKALYEYKGFRKGIRDFVLTKDKIFFYYASNASMVGIFDLATAVRVEELGLPSDAHKILTMQAGVAPMTLFQNKLVYMSTDKLTLNFVELTKLDTSKLELDDEEFYVNKLERPIDDYFGSDRMGLINFMTQNSVVSHIYSSEDILVVIAEIGKADRKASSEEFRPDKPIKFDISEKYNKFYFFDNHLNYKYSLRTDKGIMMNKSLSAMYGNTIYSITTNNGDDFHNELVRYD